MSIFRLCNVIHCNSKSKHDCVKNLEAHHKENSESENSLKLLNFCREMESDKANLKAAKVAFQKLKTEWSKRPPNLDLCGQLLTELKVHR